MPWPNTAHAKREVRQAAPSVNKKVAPAESRQIVDVDLKPLLEIFVDGDTCATRLPPVVEFEVSMKMTERQQIDVSKPYAEMNTDELLSTQQSLLHGTREFEKVQAELNRRQFRAQLDATDAQKIAAVAETEAARAAIETAIATKHSAVYVMLTAIAAAISAAASLIASLVTIAWHHS